MDSSSSQSRSFITALASAIKAIAMLIIDLVGVAQEGVAMADKTIKVARERQGIELAISMSDYAETARQKAAVEQAQAQEALTAYVNEDKSGERQKLVQANLTRLKLAIEAGQAEIKLDRASRKF
jgi:hypothetical protein